MIRALETASGILFPDPAAAIEVTVSDGASMTAYGCRSIRLGAFKSATVKRALLMHELGHCLAFSLPRTAELDDHRILFLFLYDALADMYGPTFADRIVAAESASTSVLDYDVAWSWALRMTRRQREEILQQLRKRGSGLHRRAKVPGPA